MYEWGVAIVPDRNVNLRALDVLRGLLAVYVVLGHARWLLWAGHAAWAQQPHATWEIPLAYGSAVFRFGHEAVMVFFVLSGFFIHLRFAEQAAPGTPGSFSAGAFYKRRWHRLAAPYFAVLVLTFVLDAAGREWFPRLYLAGTGDALLDENFARKDFSAAAVVPALFILPSSMGKDFGSNGPLWSLGYEVVYYAMYPAWLWLRRKGVMPAMAGGLVVAAIGGWLGNSFIRQVALLYPLWLVGAFMAELAVRREAWLVKLGHWLVLAVPLLVVPVFLPLPSLLSVMFSLLGGAATVGWFAAMPPGWMSHSFLRAAEFLGIRSYTIYIAHFPVIALMAAAWIQPHGDRPLHGWWALCGAAAALAVGLVCFHLVERRCLHARLTLHPSHV